MGFVDSDGLKRAFTKLKSITDAIDNKADKAQQTANNISIGGRNYIYKTEEMPIGKSNTENLTYRNYNQKSVANVTRTDDGVKITYSGITNEGLTIPLAVEGSLKNDEPFLFSFMYRGNITSLGSLLYVLQKTSPNVSMTGKYVTLIDDEQWHTCSFRFTSSNINARVATDILIGYNTNGYDNTKWFEVKSKSIKLEYGNKPTDWTPAPEDLYSYVDEQSSKLLSTYGALTDDDINEVFDNVLG